MPVRPDTPPKGTNFNILTQNDQGMSGGGTWRIVQNNDANMWVRWSYHASSTLSGEATSGDPKTGPWIPLTDPVTFGDFLMFKVKWDANNTGVYCGVLQPDRQMVGLTFPPNNPGANVYWRSDAVKF
jgi:hypothetical protein